MNVTLILWLLCFVFREIKTEIRELKRYVKGDGDEIIIGFICKEDACFPGPEYDRGAGYYADVEQPIYKCDVDGQTFDLHQNIFTGHPGATTLILSHLRIEHLKMNETFSTITNFDASHNQLSSIPMSISMPNLTHLDLSGNNFTSLTSGNFQFIA